jgi:hypothetical protein
VQDRAPPGCGARDLHEPEAQTETGISISFQFQLPASSKPGTESW